MSRNTVPCPFCGKDPVVRRGQGYEYGMHRVVCMSADCTIPKTEHTGLVAEREAIKAWNKQWADGVICNLSEQNIALSKDCQRLMRANEKYRRKLAKRRAQHLRQQYNPEFGFGDFSSWYNMWHSLQLRWRTSAMRLQLRFEFKNERQRNPGLRKFLTWQDAFTFTLGAEAPALELKAELKP